MNPIDKMILSEVKCLKCGAAYGACDCWTKHTCGWFYAKGTRCRNPECQTAANMKPTRRR